MGRSQRPNGLRSGSTAASYLGLWVRIPPEAWMSVRCGCCVLLGRGLCNGPITHPEQSYRVWCVCDRGTLQGRHVEASKKKMMVAVGFSPLRSGFKSVHLGFVANKVAKESNFLRLLRFSIVGFHSTSVPYSFVYEEKQAPQRPRFYTSTHAPTHTDFHIQT